MARRAYGQSSAQKKGNHVAVAGPLLARGRSENLIRSASCTPSEEGSAMDEDESVTIPTESTYTLDPSSPTSGRLSSTISFSPQAFSPPASSRAHLYTSIGAQAHEDDFRRGVHRDEGIDSVGGVRGDLAGLLHTNQTNVSYPLRMNEIQQSSPSVVQSPTSIVTSPPLAPGFTAYHRRPSENGFRPIAQKPLHYRIDADALDIRDQAAARAVIGKPKGIKKPYKNQEERDKVKAVRQYGACLRCAIMRQACEVTEEGQPCANCQVQRRKFNIPCTRAGPATRWKYLFPELVTNQHDPKFHRVHFGEEMPGMFRLPLTHASGFSVELNVVEDPSMIPESERDKIYFAEEGDPDTAELKMQKARSPPLVPVISTSFSDVANWIAQQIVNNKSGLLVNLPYKLFPQSKGQNWPRDVLFLFQEYHEKVHQSKIVMKLFRTLTVRHLMSRHFYVPFDSLREVNKHLSPEYQETEEDSQERKDKEICLVFKFVNRYFKSALMYLLRESLKNDFTQLEDLFKLHEKSPGSEITDLDRDEALCFVALILLVVSIQQSKIMQAAKTLDAEASQNCPFGRQTQNVRQAKEIIQTIEEEVINHILGLFSYKFVKSNRKGTLRPDQAFTAQQAKHFDLVTRFIESKQDHRSNLASYTDLTLNLDDDKVDRFLVSNPTRVLLRFAETLTPSKSRKSQQPR